MLGVLSETPILHIEDVPSVRHVSVSDTDMTPNT